jgi:histidine kinase/DNA gyrase B/HSP90-like ATPase
MAEYTLTPKVDQAQEFIEIANDFANPLDLVREAISNAFDATANEIRMSFETDVQGGETVFVIRITDNGSGMDKSGLQSFFDLGNSTRRGDADAIGEKGHGTKVYFNSKKVVVDTQRDGTRRIATLDSPFARLHSREIPSVTVTEEKAKHSRQGRRSLFTHTIITVESGSLTIG